jgi:hypothetical protein
MTTRWIQKLLRAWPRGNPATKRAAPYAELPETSTKSESGRANFRPAADASRQAR